MRCVKIFRISTVSHSLSILLRNQFKYIGELGYDYTLMCYPDKQVIEQSKLEKASFFPLYLSRKLSPFSDLVQLIRLSYHIIRFRPDIIHTHSPKAGLIGMIAGKITGVKCNIHTVAGMPLLDKSGIYRRLLILLERLCYRCSDYVVFNSPAQAKYVLDNNWIKPSKVGIIRYGSSNGIDTSYFSRDAVDEASVLKIANEAGYAKGDLCLVFVGRIAKSKGIEELIVAFSGLESRFNNLKLILVGSEDTVDPVESSTWTQIRSNPNIIWFDYQHDVRPFFKISDIFVFPSYREGFPQVIMQACSMGCAIVATDINGANEIIQDGSSGLLITPKSAQDLERACERLIKEEFLRKKIASKSRQNIVDKFDQIAFWNDLAALYKRLLED